MLASEGIVPNRRNHRETRRKAHGHSMLIEVLKEHQNGHAPYDAVLDSFVVL
jgi:hypothetical protein